MADGWIKLHRKSIESRVFSDASLWRLWTWCLLRANHATGFFQGEEIHPGSFATGTRVAGETLGLAPTTVHRGLKRLAKWNMISLKVKRGYTLVTICNYATYQDGDASDETQMKRGRNANGTLAEHACSVEETLATPNKNNNNNKNLPPSPPPATQGGDSPRSAAWKGVEGDLLKCGVNAAGKAVAAAIANECRPDDVTNVVAFWRLHSGQWKAGALYQRILILRPGQDCSEHWPEPSAEFVAIQQREKSVRSQSAMAATRESAAKEKAAAAKKMAAMDAEFGQKIDEMSADEVRDLIRREMPETAEFLLSRYRGDRVSGTLRESLLLHFSETREAVDLLSEAP